MSRARRFGRLEILILVMLSLFASAAWSQVMEIDDLSDAKTTSSDLFLGSLAGGLLTTGVQNTGVGISALISNTMGSNNTASGWRALRTNTTGRNNTASGAIALSFNTTGDNNTATGSGALRTNTTGSNNTASGYTVLSRNTTGSHNTASGYQVLFNNGTGSRNTASGFRALPNNVSGGRNVAVGSFAGGRNTTGRRNVFIGTNAGNNSNYRTRSNRLVIANTKTTKPLIAGNFKRATLRIHGALSANSLKEVSDVRLKTNIAPLQNSLSSVLRLKGKTYEWRKDPERVMPEGRAIGLIAQEVEEVLPELVSEDEDGYKGIEYSKLTAVLVEAIKEQQKQIEALRIRVAELES